MKQEEKYGPFLVQGDVANARTAYPGTMLVYTAAKTANLTEDAATVAEFIRISTTEGQQPGPGTVTCPTATCRSARPA